MALPPGRSRRYCAAARPPKCWSGESKPVMTVSYCVPLYNKQRYIAAVLAAALAERAVTGGEVLVYDDASTDESGGAGAAIGARHSITMIDGGHNRGVFHATTVLIERASEPYLRII